MADTSEIAIFSFLERLYSTIMKEDGKQPPPTGLVVSMMAQGQVINPKDFLYPWTPYLGTDDEGPDATIDKPDPLGDIIPEQSLKNTCELVNRKLALSANYQVMPGTASISDTWEAIITSATIDPNAISHMSDAQKKKFAEVREKLYETRDIETIEKGKKVVKQTEVKTAAYQTYLEKQDAYNKANNSYVNAYLGSRENNAAKKAWAIIGKTYIDAVDGAYNDWMASGKKQIEEALNILAAEGSDPSAGMIAKAQNRFAVYQAAAGGVFAVKTPYVRLSPSNWCDLNVKPEEDGFMEYEGTFTKTSVKAETHHKDWHAEIKVNVGLFGGDASTKGAIDQANNDMSGDSTYIYLKYALVAIERPWLDTSLFSMDNWYMVGGKKNSISNGTMPDPNPAKHYLPMIPTHMIVVKNLRIKNAALQQHFDSIATSISAEASLHYGPFVSVGGGYNQTDTETNQFENSATEGLKINGMQVIGWVSEVMPSSPKMDAPVNAPAKERVDATA